MKLLILYTTIIAIFFVFYGLIYTYDIDMMTSFASHGIMGIFLLGILIYFCLKWYKSMKLEETFVNIQLIED